MFYFSEYLNRMWAFIKWFGFLQNILSLPVCCWMGNFFIYLVLCTWSEIVNLINEHKNIVNNLLMSVEAVLHLSRYMNRHTWISRTYSLHTFFKITHKILPSPVTDCTGLDRHVGRSLYSTTNLLSMTFF